MARECKEVLVQLLELDEELLVHSPHAIERDLQGLHHIDVDASSGVSELSDCMNQRYQSWRDFRRSSLDYFHRQAFLQTGGSAKKGSMRALQQGISAQV